MAYETMGPGMAYKPLYNTGPTTNQLDDLARIIFPVTITIIIIKIILTIAKGLIEIVTDIQRI